MSYKVGTGNVWGRLGGAIGQGIQESLPREAERLRMAKGLEELGKEAPNLNPFQILARASTVPGSTPQLVQSFTELAKQASARNAYANRAAGGSRGETGQQPSPTTSPAMKALQDNEFANLPKKRGQPKEKPSENVSPNAYGQPKIVETNPLREEAIPRRPWTPERKFEEIATLGQEFPMMTIPELQQMAADNEARELAGPSAEQTRDQYVQGVKQDLNDKFRTQLEQKLQKKGDAVYKDIPGEMISNIERSMERELRANPNATVDDVVNKWSNKALNLAKAKTQLDKLSGSSLFATPILLNKDSYRKKLNEYGDIYRAAGNSEEFYNTLQSNFTMSPQGAASLAYPRNQNVKKYVDSVRPSKMHDFTNYTSNSRKQAIDVEKLITSDDSLLAIARDLREKDPYFDQQAFFDQLSEDKEELGLNERQRRELAQDPQMLPSWGDVLILPLFRGIK